MAQETLINETVKLQCRCGSFANLYSSCYGRRADIAGFLRKAIDDGWVRINPEPTRAVETADGVEIDLYGDCPNCVMRTRHSLTERITRRERSAR